MKKFNPERPIVFLDIDGVLNSGEDHEHIRVSSLFSSLDTKSFRAGNWVTKSKLKLLHEFLNVIDAQVIMVSSWFWGNAEKYEHILENHQICEFLGLLDRTLTVSRYTGGGVGRGREVLKIVESLGLKDWVVVDDAGNTMYEFDTHQINGRIGLTEKDVLILLERLKDGKH